MGLWSHLSALAIWANTTRYMKLILRERASVAPFGILNQSLWVEPKHKTKHWFSIIFVLCVFASGQCSL